MSQPIQIIHAYNKKQLYDKLMELQQKQESVNPRKKVNFTVIPKPSEVNFNDYDEKAFTVGLDIKEEELVTFKKKCPKCRSKNIEYLAAYCSLGMEINMFPTNKHQYICRDCDTIFYFEEI